jgi:hypothetical protein
LIFIQLKHSDLMGYGAAAKAVHKKGALMAPLKRMMLQEL